ncbi:hypothetical protein BHE90_011992 [Fusarium euwallaceae]|uniref:Uncharacterized protein n=2 Tax=Fusarium solani species complex TaxID=232080 RepID=A0A430LCX5_9HYPO|nr:hypothetical protein CEP51_007010 [Fusarium floridanum]RTE73566.1 hypothetical protein BHE90_011992 [Fusarium euwallaceae]
MDDRRRRVSLSREQIRQVQDDFDDLVDEGQIKIPRGTRLRMGFRGLEVTAMPIPAISEDRINQILDHIKANLFDRSAEWRALYDEWEGLAGDDTGRRRYNHERVWERIKFTQQVVMHDFQVFNDLVRDLDDHPDRIKEVDFPSFLPQLVARMLGVATCRSRTHDHDEAARLMVILEDHHDGFFLLLNRIFELHRRAKAHPSDDARLGELASRYFSPLVMALASKDPSNDMDHQVFQSLKERVSKINHGHRAPSPGVDDDEDVDVDFDSE